MKKKHQETPRKSFKRNFTSPPNSQQPLKKTFQNTNQTRNKQQKLTPNGHSSPEERHLFTFRKLLRWRGGERPKGVNASLSSWDCLFVFIPVLAQGKTQRQSRCFAEFCYRFSYGFILDTILGKHFGFACFFCVWGDVVCVGSRVSR